MKKAKKSTRKPFITRGVDFTPTAFDAITKLKNTERRSWKVVAAMLVEEALRARGVGK